MKKELETCGVACLSKGCIPLRKTKPFPQVNFLWDIPFRYKQSITYGKETP